MKSLALLDEFRAETSEHLNALDAHMVELERNPVDPQPLRELFRSAHTITGRRCPPRPDRRSWSSLMLSRTLLASLRDGCAPLDRATTELLFRAIDALRDLAPGAAWISAAQHSGRRDCWRAAAGRSQDWKSTPGSRFACGARVAPGARGGRLRDRSPAGDDDVV